MPADQTSNPGPTQNATPSTSQSDTPGTQIHQNVDTILSMQQAEVRALSHHQRFIEKAVAWISVPAALFVVVALIAAWIVANLVMMNTGLKPWDPPPFGLLQTIVSILAILLTLVVVITQNRQGKTAELNAQIELQIDLLLDQKASKIIQLLEEMRVDSPALRNRVDPEAEELQVAVDPKHVASVLAEKMALSDSEDDDSEKLAEEMGAPDTN